MKNIVCKKQDTFTKQDVRCLFALRCGRPVQASTLMHRLGIKDIYKFKEQFDKLFRMDLIIEQDYYGDNLYRLSEKGHKKLESIFNNLLYAYDEADLTDE